MELKMNLSQNITLSQKMIQSMEILQMSSIELEAFIKNEALENPVVDLEEGSQGIDKMEDIQRKLEWLEETDEQNQVYYRQEAEADRQSDDWKFTSETGEQLADFLLSQLLTNELSQRDYAIMEYIILSLDSKGYYTDDLEETAQHFSITKKELEEALIQVQELEPAGVGARDLSECLLLQLKRMGQGECLEKKIVSQYLEQVGKNRLPFIAKELGVTLKEVTKACQAIKELNPKPGNAFHNREQLKYIIPDVVVVKLEGYYEILVNEYKYSRIHINDYYSNMLKQSPDQEVKKYLNQKIRQADWITNCISQRNFTLSRVTRAIVETQDEFFAKGPKFKKPMNLKRIATKLEIHESTVSRAVRDKYLQCSFGVFPMSFFFTGAVSTGGANGAMTPEQIKDMIREIIEQEDKQKPYSDRMIEEKLLEQQVKVSRRTVAKYRESMEILDARGRKSYLSS